MLNRKIDDLDVSVLGFGTSAFTKNGLNDKSYYDEMLTFETAIERNINVIHSNRELQTQWAVKLALEKYPQKNIYNIIKIKLSKEFSETEILDRINDNIIAIGSENVIIQLELSKNTVFEIADYKTLNDIIKNTSLCKYLFIFFANMESELKMAIEILNISAYASKLNFNNCWAVKYFDDLKKIDKSFIAVSPFNRNQLDDISNKIIEYVGCDIFKNLNSENLYPFFLSFCLYHPVVKTVIVSTKTIDHLFLNLKAIDNFRIFNELVFEKLKG